MNFTLFMVDRLTSSKRQFGKLFNTVVPFTAYMLICFYVFKNRWSLWRSRHPLRVVVVTCVPLQIKHYGVHCGMVGTTIWKKKDFFTHLNVVDYVVLLAQMLSVLVCLST